MNIKRKVIEVVIKGEKKYLCSSNVFGDKPTDNPMEATNYLGDDEQLKRDLENVVIQGDNIYARSGVRIDTAPVVVEMEIELKCTELSRAVGREMRQ